MQLVDSYSTFIPAMTGYFYGTHLHAKGDPLGSRIAMTLLWIWSARLTYAYFRRENWQWGEREDWRFTQLRKQHPRHWWWMSFFAVYISQQVWPVLLFLHVTTVYFLCRHVLFKHLLLGVKWFDIFLKQATVILF
jgi:steroid 5-alpha reductase family enzyme